MAEASVSKTCRFRIEMPSEAVIEITCNQLSTVQEAIELDSAFEKERDQMKVENKSIITVIIRKEKNRSAVASHFPCQLIDDDELLQIVFITSKVKRSMSNDFKTETHGDNLSRENCHMNPKEYFVTFLIDATGGKNAKTKQLLKNPSLRPHGPLCIYSEPGGTIKEALIKDGRFHTTLFESTFSLIDVNKSKTTVPISNKVAFLKGRHFQIALKRNPDFKQTPKAITSTKTKGQHTFDPEPDTLHRGTKRQRTDTMSSSAEKSTAGHYQITLMPHKDDIMQLLRSQMERLKTEMEKRYPKKTFQEVLNLKRENFGNIWQPFSEVHMMRELIELGNSVCRIDVGNSPAGTGFVLFDNFILTNAHLFVNNTNHEIMSDNVSVVFKHESPLKKTHRVKAKGHLIDCHYDADENKRVLDYAILELESQTTQAEWTLPVGLLSKCAPVPKTGEACLIGHPGGGVKKMDLTCIITVEERCMAVEKQFETENIDIVFTIFDELRGKQISNIFPGGDKQGDVSTYNTCFYYGSSGSPVFNSSGQVFGLHTGGIVYTDQHKKKGNVTSVIEYAHPLYTILENFVIRMKSGQLGPTPGSDKMSLDVLEELQKRFWKEAKKNDVLCNHLNEIAGSVMDVDQAIPIE